MVDHEKDLAALNEAELDKISSVRYVVKQKDGTYHSAWAQNCYNSFTRMVHTNSEYIVNAIQKGGGHYNEVDKEHHRLYLDWLMNESPFTNGFLEKDVDWSLDNSCTFHHLDQPGNMLLGCMSAVRAMTEDYSCPGYKYFKPLVDAGCSKAMAFIFCFYLIPDGKNSVSWHTKKYDGNHSVWPEFSARKEHVVAFLKGKTPGLQKGSFKKNKDWLHVHELFGKKLGGDPFEIIAGDFAPFVMSNCEGTKEVVTKEPWENTARTYTTLELPVADMCEQLAKISEKIHKEWLK